MEDASLNSLESSPSTAGNPADTDGGKKKKKAKVRSAWISFIGRILAQMFGAVATVTLGLQVVQSYLPPPPDSAAVADQAARPARPEGVTGLAVLPVANYTGDPRRDAFTDGLTEALIAAFAQVADLQVTSRTSSMHFRGQGGLLPAIARQLGVDVVLEASVVTGSDRLRITAQLIDARSDTHIWTRTYDPEERNLLALQSSVVDAIVQDARRAIGTSRQHRAAVRSAADQLAIE